MTLNLKSVTNLFVPTTLAHRRAAAETELDTARTAFDAAALRSVEAEGNPEDKRPLAEARKALKEAADRLEAAHNAIATLDAAARAAEAQAHRRTADEAERAEQARLDNVKDALVRTLKIAEKLDGLAATMTELIRGDLAREAGRVREYAKEGEVSRSIEAAYGSLLPCLSHHINKALGRIPTEFFDRTNPDAKWSHYIPELLIRPKK